MTTNEELTLSQLEEMCLFEMIDLHPNVKWHNLTNDAIVRFLNQTFSEFDGKVQFNPTKIAIQLKILSGAHL